MLHLLYRLQLPQPVLSPPQYRLPILPERKVHRLLLLRMVNESERLRGMRQEPLVLS